VISAEITGSTSTTAKKTFVGIGEKARSGTSSAAIHTNSAIAAPTRRPDDTLTAVPIELE
jgi:hypothetical protein